MVVSSFKANRVIKVSSVAKQESQSQTEEKCDQSVSNNNGNITMETATLALSCKANRVIAVSHPNRSYCFLQSSKSQTEEKSDQPGDAQCLATLDVAGSVSRNCKRDFFEPMPIEERRNIKTKMPKRQNTLPSLHSWNTVYSNEDYSCNKIQVHRWDPPSFLAILNQTCRS